MIPPVSAVIATQLNWHAGVFASIYALSLSLVTTSEKKNARVYIDYSLGGRSFRHDVIRPEVCTKSMLFLFPRYMFACRRAM